MQDALPLDRIAHKTRVPSAHWKRWLLLLPLSGLVAAGLAGYAFWRVRTVRSSASDQPELVFPELRTLAAAVTTTGTVRLKSGAEVRVGAQVSGMVRQLNVTVGARIHAGDVIAEIDARAIDAQIEQARTQVEMDRVASEKAQRDLARSQDLVSNGLVPRQQLEDAQWQLKSALAKLANSQSDLAAAKLTLSYTVIKAPISGTVSSVSTQEGETVAASFAAPTFVTIVQDSALELVAMVDETDIANVRPGQLVTFTVEAFTSHEFSGVVKRIDPTATIISGVVNYQVIAEIRKDLSLLKPDMTANISIQTAKNQALVIPNSAIHREGEQRFVYLRRGNTQQRQNVSIGSHDGRVTEIVKGLTAADQIAMPAATSASKKD